MQTLLAAREFVYAGRKIGAGQTFLCCEPDVAVLTQVGLASPMPPIDDDPEPEPEPDEPEPLKRRRGRPRKSPVGA